MYFSLNKVIKKYLNYIIALAAITLLAYIFSLNNKFVWDDEQFIYRNSYVKNFQVKNIFTESTIAGAGEVSTYYRPLTTFSFAIDHSIWGLNPIGFHLTNTLLHLGTGILLFFYLKSLGFSKITSLTIASIFLVHPLQTEAVVYANSRGDSMYSFWGMASLLSFSLLLKNKLPKIEIYDLEVKFGKKILFATTLVFYFFAIIGKEIGIATLGLLGLTYLFVKLQNQNFSVKKIFKKSFDITLLALAFIVSLTYLYFRNNVINVPTTLNNFFAGTPYGENLYIRLHTFTQALWKYFQLIFFPYPLHMERDLKILEQPISLWLIATVLLILVVFKLAKKEYKKSKTYFIAFGSLWFLCMLIPVSGIIPVNGFIYEHWLYMPLVGFVIFIYGLKQTIIPKKLQTKANYYLENVLPTIIIIFVILTIRQNYIWANPIRFYNYTLKFNESARLHNNLAMAYADELNYANAISHYKRAIEIGDYYPQIHYNMANAYLAINEIDLAKREYISSIRINDKFVLSYFKLIQIFTQEKAYQNITPIIDKLLEYYPNNPDFIYVKAENLINTGEIKKGLDLLNQLKNNLEIDGSQKIMIDNTIKRYQ